MSTAERRTRELEGRERSLLDAAVALLDRDDWQVVTVEAIAERAAWELVRERDAEDRLATINPSAIIGPALNDDHSFSLQSISRLLEGMPAVPKL